MPMSVCIDWGGNRERDVDAIGDLRKEYVIDLIHRIRKKIRILGMRTIF